ncbi:hypothetical protein J4H18_23170 [Vibrio alginolyticus]|uniref:hypothetical protein n=1 Tax=Vibrio alginolyticus TaxID=663 RepID=UPI001BD6B740|nr:hypothetical protein [Vibrio alginolyticus]MBS9866924.1 hypothetical protein [Vibrio alginolyticus]MBS9890026.1 hypothetical protein [Vibrio alginolyticus]MCS0288992.1 hypothetical protein [Vibrio alginolyticus]
MKELRLTNAMITFILGIIIAVLVSKGSFLGTALKYPSDFMFIVFGGLLAFLISGVSVRYLQKGYWKESALMYPIYYYGSFGLFVDGHLAGWTHSGSVGEKLMMAQIYILLSLVSVFVPVIIAAISVAHIIILRVQVKKVRT